MVGKKESGKLQRATIFASNGRRASSVMGNHVKNGWSGARNERQPALTISGATQNGFNVEPQKHKWNLVNA